MKKPLALLLVAVMAISCTFAALYVSAEEPVYTDKVNLLPTGTSEIEINGGSPVYSIESNGNLKLTVGADSEVAWPSIIYYPNVKVNLSETPYLHLNFVLDPDGEEDTFDGDSGRGVNGTIYYMVEENGDVLEAQLSKVADRDVNDFRISGETYIDFAKFAGTTDEITVTSIILTIYGERGAQSVIWNNFAFAKEGADEPEPTPSEDDETTGDETTDDETTAPADGSDETTAPADGSDETTAPADGSDETTAPADGSDETTAPADSSDETTAPAESSTPVEESSTPAPASSSTPAESSSAPSTGDSTNLILFAVLGVVALAGVAVAVKVRH